MEAKVNIVFKKILEHGPSNPIVARTTLQGMELLKFSSINSDATKQEKVFNTLLDFQRRLLVCEDIRKKIEDDLLEIDKKISQNEFKDELPQILHLQTSCEIFLYFSKLAMRDLSPIISCFFEYGKFSHNYKVHARWAERTFGKEDILSKLLDEDHEWIKFIADMRNAVEHPDSGALNINNIDFHENCKLTPPQWNIEGRTPSDILSDLGTVIENMLTFSEDLLVALVKKTIISSCIDFAQIPEEERNHKSPIRLKAILIKT
ncbi:MAG: hypothetical protein FJX03_00010 [Alphaproteobacteria bacterium]|nr:hypothetical protein [Alphaproteobacteria bacterium]